MCGISAIFSIDGSRVPPNAIDLLNSPIESRGPDGEGFFRQPSLALAHRRLAIIDTSDAANQPFHWDSRYVLIYNGEIYNYKELRIELIADGFSFRTTSDTEVLIASYSRWGPACLDKFNGMWAFVIWDNVKQQIFASRDRFGIKPLYWSRWRDTICLFSEIKQFLTLRDNRSANIDELSRFLYTGIPGSTSSTFFNGIHSLEAGHYLQYSLKSDLSIRRWYNPSFHRSTSTDFTSLLSDSIRLRLRSDVPVGSCLSGGLDSSAVVMVASQLSSHDSNHPFQTFHARSSDPEVDESSYASLVAHKSGSYLHTLTPTPNDFWSNITEICRIQDEPFGSPSICMQYFVMQCARSTGCPVLLDGQGADELLLGYPKFMTLALIDSFRTGGPLNLLRTIYHSHSANSMLTPISSLHYILGTLLSPLRSARVSRRLPFLRLPLSPVRSLYNSVSSSAYDCLQTQLLELYRTSLPALLRYEDRNSMAHSVEARLPFLDYRLVEFALSLPTNEKITNGWSKYPLRNSSILPSEVAWRKTKLGFNAPERSWIGSYTQEMLHRTLDSPLISSISNSAHLEKNWNFLSRREQWRLFNTAIWSDIYHVNS